MEPNLEDKDTNFLHEDILKRWLVELWRGLIQL
jgi:hypothetical protein